MNRFIPLLPWTVDATAGIAKLNQLSARNGRGNLKAATDPVAVFRPVTPCRLFDTRSGVSPIPAIQGAPFPPNTHQTINAGNHCGIPALFVSGISATVFTFNHTVNNGGGIALVPAGAPATGSADVFNIGAQWSATSQNIPTTDAGAFDVYVFGSNADVIIDVNGYYQNLDSVDVGPTEMDFFGNSTGDVLEVTQSGSGSALSAGGFGAGSTALTITQGPLHITGAVTLGDRTGWVHTATPCGGGSFSALNHPLLNGKAAVLIFVTPRQGSSPGPFEVTPSGVCGTTWALHDKSGGTIAGAFNILIIHGD